MILHFAVMALCSCQNAQQGSARHSNLDELTNSVQGTPTALSNADSLDASVPTPTPIKYTKEDLWKTTKLCIDLFLQAEASCLKAAGHQEAQGLF